MSDYITLDYETRYGTKYSLNSMSYEEYIFHQNFHVHGVGIKINAGKTKYYPDVQVKDALADIFHPGNTHTMIGHNLLFDAAILSWHHGLRAERYWCTQAMSNGLYPQFSASLKFLAERLWPNDPSMRKGTELEDFKNVDFLTPEQQERMGGYCIQDVDLTFAAAQEMVPRLPADELEAIDWTIQQFAHPVLLVEQQRLREFLAQYREETARTIAASGTTRGVLASNPQFAAWVEANHGIVIPPILSPTAKDPENQKIPLSKTDKEFINLQLEHSELEHVWKARMVATSNLAETRAERMILHSSLQPGGRLAIPTKYYGAHTGRWSGCNKINIQNLQSKSPHRLALMAPEGYRIGVRDLSNIEGRVLAWFAEQYDKCDTFATGEDLYDRIASRIYGRQIRRKQKASHPDTGKEYYPDEMEGFVGKTLELGLGYRMGKAKLRHQFLVGGRESRRLFFSEEECHNFVTVYRKLNDKIEASWRTGDAMLYNMTQRDEPIRVWKCLEVGYRWIKLPNGMYLTYPNLRRVEDERGDVSFVYFNGKHDTHIHGGKLIENIIQALARIIMNDGRRKSTQYLKKYNDPTVRVVTTVHDELVSVLRQDTADEDLAMIGALMCEIPSWAQDGYLHLATEGGHDVRYSK
jgi:DNA polymerase